MRADIATLIQQGNIPLARDKAEKSILDEAFGDLLADLEMQAGLLLEHFHELEHGYAKTLNKESNESLIIFIDHSVTLRCKQPQT